MQRFESEQSKVNKQTSIMNCDYSCNFETKLQQMHLLNPLLCGLQKAQKWLNMQVYLQILSVLS